MVSESSVMLTDDGMARLSNDLLAFQARRAVLAEAIASSSNEVSGVEPELSLTDRRITEIRSVLARAQTIDDEDRTPGVVGLGSRVTVRWEEDGEETYTIVDPAEAASSTGRISNESPVGQAVMNGRAGDRVKVDTIVGPVWLKVLAVE